MPTPCEFSETNYAFCYVHEFCNRLHSSGLLAFPFFPTLHLEHQIGYDALIRSGEFYGLCLQFKVPELVKLQSLRKHNRPSINAEKVLRFKAGTHQIEKLKEYSLNHKENPSQLPAYFAIPRFYTREALEECFTNSSLLSRSVLVPTNKFPAPPKDHWVYFSEVPSEKDKYVVKSRSIIGDLWTWNKLLSNLKQQKPFSLSDLIKSFADELQAFQLESNYFDDFNWKFLRKSYPESSYKELKQLLKLQLLLHIKYGFTLILLMSLTSK